MMNRNDNIVTVSIPITGYMIVTAEVDGVNGRVDSIGIMQVEFEAELKSGIAGMVTPVLSHRPLGIGFKIAGDAFRQAIDFAVVDRKAELRTEES